MKAELEMALVLADPKCPLLIQHEGKPVFDWKTACRLAQTDHAFFHDLRRTTLTKLQS
jgi:hypothetical protein